MKFSLQDFRLTTLPLLLAALLLPCGRAAAQVPETISYQGFLSDSNGNAVEGQHNLSFRLYDQAAFGTPLWAETHSDVQVSSGIFAVRLGRIEPLFAVPFERTLYLAVSIDDGEEMAPRVVLTSSPRSLSTRGLRISLKDDHVSSVVLGSSGNDVPDGTEFATVGGGSGNRATALAATVSGGDRNEARGFHSSVGGGVDNTAGGTRATVGGGQRNLASGTWSTVPGGVLNQARGRNSFAMGHSARAAHDGTFVWRSSITADSLVSTGENQFLIEANGGVGIGTNAPTSPLTVAGVVESTEGGFKFPDGSVQQTAASSSESGSSWQLGGNRGTTPDTDFLGTTDAAPLVLKTNGRRVFYIEPGRDNDDAPNLIAGYETNRVERNGNEATALQGATISGGGGASEIGGVSEANVVSADFGTIGGGRGNRALGQSSTVGGGQFNIALTSYDVVAGGRNNRAAGSGDFSSATVGGGTRNSAGGEASTIGGGADNRTIGSFAVIPGGRENEGLGSYSLAAGRNARAMHDGAFVWASGSDDNFSSTAANQFLIRAAGGVGIGTNSPAGALHITHPADETDLVLGGAGESTFFGDDGMISSDPNLPSSDLLLLSNDAVGVVLDVDGSDDEAAEFIVTDDGLDEVFRVDLTGTATTGRVVLDDELGEDATLESGGVYRDNVVYAWAHVEANGSSLASFGCTVTKVPGFGQYRVTFDRRLTEGLAPVVTPRSGNPVMASLLPAGDNSEVNVYLFALNGDSGIWERADNAFFIQVVGRP